MKMELFSSLFADLPFPPKPKPIKVSQLGLEREMKEKIWVDWSGILRRNLVKFEEELKLVWNSSNLDRLCCLKDSEL